MRALVRIILPFALALAALVLFERSAAAYPRYALREGVQCVTCHVDPAGGGMRNRYGRYKYAPTRLPLFNSPSIPPLNVDIGETLAFGADSRSMYYYAQPSLASGNGKTSTFFQMESNLYAAARLYRGGRDGGSGVTLYYTQMSWNNFEAMGLFQQELGRPDVSLYLKAGRFIPAYGIRFENHNNYVRQDLGFGPTDQDQGLEFGAHLGPLLLQGSVLNGTSGPAQFDDNTAKAVTARAEIIRRFGKLRLMLGGSFYRSETGSATTVSGISSDGRAILLKTGAHWGASMGRISYMGELDISNNNPFPENKQATRSHTFQSYQELDFIVLRGLELNLNYEFRDPDTNVQSGILQRFSAGFEIMPIPYVEIKTLFRHSIGTGRPGGLAAMPQDGLNEVIAMLHLYF